MRRFFVLIPFALVVAACGGSGDPDPAPTSAAPVTSAAPSVATTTAAAESASALLSEQLSAWNELGVTDYDLEYVLDRVGGRDSGTYRAEVRDGEPVNCFLDGQLSMRIECDAAYYSVESVFARIVVGDARTAEIEYDDTWHFPSAVRHELRADLGAPYTLDVTSFVEQDPIDWVAFVADAIDWLETVYAGSSEVDWEELRGDALALVQANPRLTNAYLGLERATQTARGSFFRTPREVALDDSRPHDVVFPTGDEPAGERIGDVGYVKADGAFPDQVATYAAAVHALMDDIDTTPVCGWIVDLRAPHFDDVARDLLAFGPLFGEAPEVRIRVGANEPSYTYVGGSVQVDGVPAADYFESRGSGTAGLDLDEPYVPAAPEMPVAVLTSIQTGLWPLAGFIERPNAYIVGEPAQGGFGHFIEGDVAVLDLPLGGRCCRAPTQKPTRCSMPLWPGFPTSRPARWGSPYPAGASS
jgi:hypothetical protein